MVTQFGGLTKINLQQLNMQKNIKLNMSSCKSYAFAKRI